MSRYYKSLTQKATQAALNARCGRCANCKQRAQIKHDIGVLRAQLEKQLYDLTTQELEVCRPLQCTDPK